MWSRDNYFYHGYCTASSTRFPSARAYERRALSKLLAMSDAELKERVTLFHGSWGDAEPPTSLGFTLGRCWTAWTGCPRPSLATLVKDMLSRCDRAKCRVFWRSYAPGPMLQQKATDLFTVHSPALAQLPHREVQSYDRVGWYLSQWTATIPQDADLDALCPAGPRKPTRTRSWTTPWSV